MRNNINFNRTKFSCFFAYPAMSSVFVLPPVLFTTFREMYGISYTLLGTLVLINFCTQLIVDLVFSFFAGYFNIRKVIRIMPLLTALGLLIYAVVPTLMPQYAYAGLAVGTLIFSVSSGLCEVLVSPIMAALPSDNSKRDMSTLHSLYAYGFVGVTLLGTAFLVVFGVRSWMYLVTLCALFPIVSHIMFCISPIPEMNISLNSEGESKKRYGVGLALFVLFLFFGSASENAMTNWVSTYAETVLRIPKLWCDVFGMAMFALLLGLGRTLYAKFGKHLSAVLLSGTIGASVCYLVAGFSGNVIVSMLACIFTGFFTSMLWPGTLILLEEKMPCAGVVAYALMAAGGDLGGSVAPQLLGVLIDKVSLSNFASKLGVELSLTAEQIGLKTGMVFAAVFPLFGIVIMLMIMRHFSR